MTSEATQGGKKRLRPCGRCGRPQMNFSSSDCDLCLACFALKHSFVSKDNSSSSEVCEKRMPPKKYTTTGKAAKATKAPPPPQTLSPEQQQVLDVIATGENVFFTGSAGTGKSYILRYVVQELCRRHGSEHVSVTASTGVAACNIGGTTLHSFAGVGLGRDPLETLLQRVRKSPQREKWLRCKALVIDEISMIGPELFDKIEQIACSLKKNSSPFGGIQLIVCGDFLQLPPVTTVTTVTTADQKSSSATTAGDAYTFCFQTERWAACFSKPGSVIQLTQVFRQNDKEFIELLQRMRKGILTEQDHQQLFERQTTTTTTTTGDDVKPTILYSHRGDVDDLNTQHLGKLSGDVKTFTCRDWGPESLTKGFDQVCPAVLELKTGAQVILLRNLDCARGLVNGARGVVVGFSESSIPELRDMPMVKFLSGEVLTMVRAEWTIEVAGEPVAGREQIPLKLAWALSIHKSQGMTIDCLEISLGKVFECGQAYVALSRGTSLAKIKLIDYNPHKVKANPIALDFYNKLS
jgi:ATP-dependent DNA helicase PIF1